MLYYLLYEVLQPYFSPLRLFQFHTFRAAYATIIAFLICLIFGAWTIRKLQVLKFGQPIRRVGLESHFKKEGTPTMGGLLIMGAWLTATLLFADLSNPLVLLVMFAAIWFGALGLADDWLKVKRNNSDGLSPRWKLALQFLGSVAIGLFLAFHQSGADVAPTQLVFPFVKHWQPTLPVWLYVPWVVLVLIATTNSVNFTDGQDGLLITSSTFVVGTLAVLSYLVSHAVLADYLDIPHIREADELVIYCTALVGAGLGFLWWNAYPAEVFMGDVGSMSLGAAIGTVALATKQELLLVIMGGIFVVEGASVMLQVWYYKRTKKRLFRMAPIHHHFEKGGTPEPKVTVRFWIIGAILMLVALSTLKIR
ncbi:MAG: phospho-N-acetylmuramoyl-pentapeptide-transferase [Candidatus Poribacteria bacterium]|nr:phospho-N-acetylmuramoyl-pentapeptide-transferase [Candidatus Poribacteria bacterium]